MLNYSVQVNDLDQFLLITDNQYRQKLSTINLFNFTKTIHWNSTQKKYFAAIFYHIRGHFINFMWYLANFSTSTVVKKIIIDNIYEELGRKNQFSHEQLYERFANECGVNIHHELVNETHYLPFVREFNKAHLKWLSEHDEDEQFAAFSAYERLDNIDYHYLSQFATSLSLNPTNLTFFNVHALVNHFDLTLEKLSPIWQTNPEKVINAINFIYEHQYTMWQKLSDCIFSLGELSGSTATFNQLSETLE